MQRSLANRQRAVIDSGFLDLTGEQWQGNTEATSLGVFEDVLAMLALEYVEKAVTNLDTADRVASGQLANSIIASEVFVFGKSMAVEIRLNDYYKFVDQGVQGWKDSGKAPNSPYQFKNTPPGRDMMRKVRKWLIREGLKGKASVNRSPKASLRDQRRASIRDTSDSAAYAMSRAIKAKGLKPSFFWSKASTEMRKRIRQELGIATKIYIIESITK